MVPLTGLEPVRSCDQGILSPWCLPIPPQRHMIKLWILSPWCLPIPPVAVPGVRLADGAAALHTDRGHSLGSLHPPQAAVASLPRFELATSSLPTILEAVLPCVACRKLLDKTLVYQGLFGFTYCSLL